MKYTRKNYGGKRPISTYCDIIQGKPVYVNTNTGEKQPIYKGKSGKLYILSGNVRRYMDKKCIKDSSQAFKQFLSPGSHPASLQNAANAAASRASSIASSSGNMLEISALQGSSSHSPVPECGPGRPRCRKGTRCNKNTKVCETHNITRRHTRTPQQSRDSADILKIKPAFGPHQRGETPHGIEFTGDICVTLKNMGELLSKKAGVTSVYGESDTIWVPETLFALHKLVPTLRSARKIYPELTNADLKNGRGFLGEDRLKLGEQVAQGSFGTIHKASLGFSPCVVKIPKKGLSTQKDILEYHAENILQTELFCALRKLKVVQKSAKIPKPVMMCKYNTKDSQKHLFAMEPLEGDLGKWIRMHHNKFKNMSATEQEAYKRTFTKMFIEMLESICLLLIDLQHHFHFYHRDMHSGNLMYKKVGENKYKWFLIDFGMSTMIVHNHRINKHAAGMYDSWESGHGGATSHDMRLLILSLMANNGGILQELLLPLIYNTLDVLERYLYQRFDQFAVPLAKYKWWRGYTTPFKYIRTPETIPSSFLLKVIGSPAFRSARR